MPVSDDQDDDCIDPEECVEDLLAENRRQGDRVLLMQFRRFITQDFRPLQQRVEAYLTESTAQREFVKVMMEREKRRLEFWDEMKRHLAKSGLLGLFVFAGWAAWYYVVYLINEAKR